MNIRIPSSQNPVMQQVNDSSILGTINESFNLDLTSDIGKIKSTKSMLSKRSTDLSNGGFGGGQNLFPGSFATKDNIIYMIAGKNMWVGGNSPSDPLVADTTPGTPTLTEQTDDLKNFNNAIYTADQNYLRKFNGSWTDLHLFATQGQAHLLETHHKRLYFVFDNYKVGNVTTGDTVSTSGTGTLDLNLPGFSIKFIKSDGNSLWIGMMNSTGGFNETTYLFKWDGETENLVQAQYNVDARGILSGTIVEGVPHVVDTSGRLMAFNGGFFQEVARFPMAEEEQLYYNFNNLHENSIHPNGMTYDSITKEVLINVGNVKRFNSSVPVFFDFPGGVWSYRKASGLVHKYSGSFQPISNSGTTGLTDAGQYNVIFGGAITCLKLRINSGDKGRVMFGQTVFTGESANYTTTAACSALFANDTDTTSQAYGYFTTSEIHSPVAIDTWNRLYTMYQKLFSVTDKIVLKYRTEKDSPTQATITWTDVDRVTTTTDVSNYQMGDEIQIVQGNGSGRSFHINSISEDGGTYTIILDDSMPIAPPGENTVVGQKGVANFGKWIKLGEITYYDTDQWKEFMIHLKNLSPMIQIKACMQFTGDNELYHLFLRSESTIN